MLQAQIVDWSDYWEKAKENLEMALLAHERKKHNVCASRAYYAVFLASIAALLKLTELRAENNEWDHGQVQAELNRRLIMRRKVLPANIGRTPMDLIELRHVADYMPESVRGKKRSGLATGHEDFWQQAKALEENT